jgi:E-phenylitaconyl-CoA hydratase
MAGTQRICQQPPHSVAMEILLTGDSIDAQTAERWGLINRVVPKEDLLKATFEVARKIARNAPLAVQATKELALRSRGVDLATGPRLEQLILRLPQGSDDVTEGARAFVEKRTPEFKGQ